MKAAQNLPLAALTLFATLSATSSVRAEEAPDSGVQIAKLETTTSDNVATVEVTADEDGIATRVVDDAMTALDHATGEGRPTGWHEDHPVALGSRTAVWIGDYSAPGLGGQIKIRPVEWIGVSLYSDNFVRPQDDYLRRDHVIGFSLFAPSVFGNEKHFISPTLGSCVDFRFADPLESDGPSASDVLFGAHLGLMAELFLYKGLSIELLGDVTGYVGHDTSIETWSTSVSNELQFSTVGQATALANYYF